MSKYFIVFIVLAMVLLALVSRHFDVTIFQLMFGYMIIVFIILVAMYAYLSEEDEGR